MNFDTKSFAGLDNSRAVSSYCASAPPGANTATRSASFNASSMSCVTKTMVLCNSACRRSISFCSSWRTTGSTAENGSSINKIGGSAASARATPTRCCSPPESWAG
ncbi:Protein of uncharacterised function (DUF1602) [Mycobacterium tuberculosis]|uniref:Protein of uncharacterized function (DUF1602) n=1 Tax=Mycobacterium tuberculosis TaxID=1773 RepID=A0A654TVX4_MYCTX|nr:Protein of uncharacterised function (DUF1602) [Mycobacterium tuberculosis]CFR66043.1 Protein of uncharacterised function (DUF1602) [Mycobacterium tuberculosis]CKU08172.1 Protein of uncharacterised function (DUF1602) [Mycobacterium tuberculosis]CKV00385.1 Protein of uncharacterised function (DUF1602) [Mycobacterium tuberculosis]CKX40571.1 Protein of uncharacterised function (DUF1602) [Mycobacterium tuberculosis]